MSSVKVFAIPGYEKLAQRLCLLDKRFEYSQYEYREFPDGERYLRILNSVNDSDVVLLGGLINDRATLDLYDLAYAMVQQCARKLILLIPYFAYSTMERSVRPGEVVTAKSRANLFSSLPQSSSGNFLAMLDLHSEGIPYYFDSNIRPQHLYAKKIILQTARELEGSDFTLACVDAGRAKWVESLANDLNVPVAFTFKKRLSDTDTKVIHVNGDVQNRRVLIYDDMCRTGSSVIEATKAFYQAGAKSVSFICTHGLFIGDSLAKLKSAGIESIVCTDSYSKIENNKDSSLQIKSVAPIFYEYILGVLS